MNFIEVLKILFLGVIEGITEWLPISSTGHMLLIDELCTLTTRDVFKEMFFVVIQLGAILAVLVLFFKQLFPLKRIVLDDGKTTIAWEKHILRLWSKVLVACLPAAIVGLFFDDWIEDLLHAELWSRPLVISFTLIIYGAFFILIENKNKGKKSIFVCSQTDSFIAQKDAIILLPFVQPYKK